MGPEKKDPILEAWHRANDFSSLVELTIEKLNGMGAALEASRTLEVLIEKWQPFDADFANLLAGVKNDIWSMSQPQIKMMAKKIGEHLEKNKKPRPGK